MKLYAAAIYGHKYYFTSELTTEAIKATERFCIQLESHTNNADAEQLFVLLLNHIKSDYNCSVTPVNIEHIFRINF